MVRISWNYVALPSVDDVIAKESLAHAFPRHRALLSGIRKQDSDAVDVVEFAEKMRANASILLHLWRKSIHIEPVDELMHYFPPNLPVVDISDCLFEAHLSSIEFLSNSGVKVLRLDNVLLSSKKQLCSVLNACSKELTHLSLGGVVLTNGYNYSLDSNSNLVAVLQSLNLKFLDLSTNIVTLDEIRSIASSCISNLENGGLLLRHEALVSLRIQCNRVKDYLSVEVQSENKDQLKDLANRFGIKGSFSWSELAEEIRRVQKIRKFDLVILSKVSESSADFYDSFHRSMNNLLAFVNMTAETRSFYEKFNNWIRARNSVTVVKGRVVKSIARDDFTFDSSESEFEDEPMGASTEVDEVISSELPFCLDFGNHYSLPPATFSTKVPSSQQPPMCLDTVSDRDSSFSGNRLSDSVISIMERCDIRDHDRSSRDNGLSGFREARVPEIVDNVSMDSALEVKCPPPSLEEKCVEAHAEEKIDMINVIIESNLEAVSELDSTVVEDVSHTEANTFLLPVVSSAGTDSPQEQVARTLNFAVTEGLLIEEAASAVAESTPSVTASPSVKIEDVVLDTDSLVSNIAQCSGDSLVPARNDVPFLRAPASSPGDPEGVGQSPPPVSQTLQSPSVLDNEDSHSSTAVPCQSGNVVSSLLCLGVSESIEQDSAPLPTSPPPIIDDVELSVEPHSHSMKKPNLINLTSIIADSDDSESSSSGSEEEEAPVWAVRTTASKRPRPSSFSNFETENIDTPVRILDFSRSAASDAFTPIAPVRRSRRATSAAAASSVAARLLRLQRQIVAEGLGKLLDSPPPIKGVIGPDTVALTSSRAPGSSPTASSSQSTSSERELASCSTESFHPLHAETSLTGLSLLGLCGAAGQRTREGKPRSAVEENFLERNRSLVRLLKAPLRDLEFVILSQDKQPTNGLQATEDDLEAFKSLLSSLRRAQLILVQAGETLE